jgi:hypothetical protein
VCKPRDEMPMQGMREEEVVLASTIIEICVVDVGGGGFCDLGIEEEDKRKRGELETELKPMLIDI